MFQKVEFESQGWNLTLKKSKNWNTSKNRLLIILQNIPFVDLQAKEVASTPVIRNSILYAQNYASKIDPQVKEYEYAVANFNDAKHLDLKQDGARTEKESEFRQRCLKLVEDWNPTHILFSGDLGVLFPQLKDQEFILGRIHKINNRFVTSTYCMDFLLNPTKDNANLLGFWCRHLSYLLLEKYPFSLRNQKSKPVYVDTIKKFKKVLTFFDKAKFIGYDTETLNLTNSRNRILTYQFCFDHLPNIGFVIPAGHSQSPFSKKEQSYIKQEMTKLFSIKNPSWSLVTFNGQFDLRVTRLELGLPMLWCRVWDILAGEHLLDENISSTYNYRNKDFYGLGSLKNILASYDDDWYFNAKFGKEDRNQINNFAPNDEGVLAYTAYDVTSIINIQKMQIKRAKLLEIQDKNYLPYFKRHMKYQMSDTVHVLSHLEQDGSYVSKEYLRNLLKPDSALLNAIKEVEEEFYEFSEVKQANEIVLQRSGFKAQSLFGNQAQSNQWAFNLNKPDHKRILFFDVMNLIPPKITKTGVGSTGKALITRYKDMNYIVQEFEQYQQANKISSTYVKSWLKRLTQTYDGVYDNHIRAQYGFYFVDTGRLNSRNPNLQNIPARRQWAKVIKESFGVEPGHIAVRFDLNAHEIRVWSYTSGDKIIADSFRVGQKLRQVYVQNPTEENKKKLITEGDIHIQNAKRFYGVDIQDKSHPLRGSAKTAGFGAIYRMSMPSIGNEMKRDKIADFRKIIKEKSEKIRLKQYENTDQLKLLKKEINKIDHEVQELIEENWSDQAEDVISKMFKEFKIGAKWIDEMSDMAVNYFYVYSPIGRRRNLFAALTGDNFVINRQVRRASNAPIQGFASEIGVKIVRLILETYYKDISKFIKVLNLNDTYNFKVKCNRIVHDANYFSVPIEMTLIFTWIAQWAATYGISQAYEKEFGFKMTVEPEIAMEFTATNDANSEEWDWSLKNLYDIFNRQLEQSKHYSKEDMKKIFMPLKNKKIRDYLQKNYPLLGVNNKILDKRIQEVIDLVY